MESAHYKLWDCCRTFVGDVCKDRDATHGLAHMETVTRQAVLIFLMSHATAKTHEELRAGLLRVVLVGMLHDVNDHKYDKDGRLEATVAAFVESVADRLEVAASELAGTAEVVNAVLTTMSAISYSKENKRGMRWFESELPNRLWVDVRDAVSDADKLEAIGFFGLVRCYEYGQHVLKDGGKWDALLEEHGLDGLRNVLLDHVVEHADEKLLRLKDTYIVTPAGKFLAEPLHQEMVDGLALWQREGAPSIASK